MIPEEKHRPISAGMKLGGTSTAYYDRDGEEIPAEQAALNEITDAVLAYRPKPKSKGAKRRTRRAKKAAKDAEDG